MPCFPCQKGAEYLEYEESHGVKNRFRSLQTFYSRSLEKVWYISVVVDLSNRSTLPTIKRPL